MARARVQSTEPCPHCGETWVRRNGKNRGRQRWLCGSCKRSFGETIGTPMYGLRTPEKEIAQTLLIVMRRASLRSAEEISGHKHETIGKWLLLANAQAKAFTEVLVKDLELDEVEVDAFWSFVGNAIHALQTGQARTRRWAAQTQNGAVRGGAA